MTAAGPGSIAGRRRAPPARGLDSPRMRASRFAAGLAILLRRRPECRVLYMSGYSSDVVARPEPTAGELLSKPFTQEELARRVHEVLREPSQAAVAFSLR